MSEDKRKLETKKQEYYASKKNDINTDTHKTKEKDAIQLKNDNDIGYTEFMNKYSVYLADGTMVPASVKKRAPIFRGFIHNQQLLDLGIVAERKAGTHSYKVILSEKLSELQRITGYRLALKEDNSHIPLKKDNDIGLNDFIQNYSILQSDGSYISRAENENLFRELTQDQQLISLGIVAKRRNSIHHIYDYIIGDRLDDLRKIKGYYIARQDDSSFVPMKNNGDLNKSVFKSIYAIYGRDGIAVSTDMIFEKLVTNQKLVEQGIVVTKRNFRGVVEKYIIGDKQEISKELLKNGYFMIERDKEAQIPAPKDKDICCRIHYRNKEERKRYKDKYVDIDFINEKGYKICEPSGRVVEKYGQIFNVFNDFISNPKLIESGVIAWRRFPWGYIQPVIDGDKLHELRQITGYQIGTNETLITPKESDIDFATFNEAYATYYFGTELYGCKKELNSEQDKNEAFINTLNNELLLDAEIVVKRRLSNGNVKTYIDGNKLKELKQKSGLVICLTKEDYIKELKEEYFELKNAHDKATKQSNKSKFKRQIYRNSRMMKFLSDGKETT